MNAGIDTGTQLRAVAARLGDIADAVAREAEGAAATIRDVTEHVQAAARLAGDLARAAGAVEAGVRDQARAVDDAKATLADREPSILALARSIDTVSAIATAIAGIAKQSQLLALNARIEAARGGEHGAGFAVVAREMSALSQATQVSTRDIGASAAAVGRDVAGAREVVAVGAELARSQDAMVASALHVAGEQRATADALTRITGGTAERIDAAATAIGRVGSNAVAVRLLARQVARIAN